MRFKSGFILLRTIFRVALLPAFSFLAGAQAPVVVSTNTTIRVMASNLTSGTNQRYETPGLDILKGLKPDIVAMQEFNYSSTTGNGVNTPAALREMVDDAFGTNFSYFRETGKNIPNGIISRFPILASGVWDDVELTDREFVWAKLGLPGTNFLYVVSVHLKASSDSTSAGRRANQANNLKTLIQANFTNNAFVIVAGDCNTYSSSEACLVTFRSFLSDSLAPADNLGATNTNAGRTERYDYVFPSFSLSSNRVATVIGSRTFPNGLVFDSRVYSPINEVAPVVSTDSGVSGMQHMGVLKDFRISYMVTNYVTVPPPVLVLESTNILRWQGLSNVAYSVQASTNLPDFVTIGAVSSSTTNVSFTNQSSGDQIFFRVVYP
ncbi:MAG: endonuclease/exonuclease/phosphatase family protein [Verrucomicrobiota bacterium]